MSHTGLQVFDRTVQETNRWLKIVMEELETDNRQVAFSALRIGLHAVRDYIGPIHAVQLGAQLPMLLRGAYYESWRLSDGAMEAQGYEALLDRVEAELPPNADISAEAATEATFAALVESLDPGEVQKLAKLLPPEVAGLWRERCEEEAEPTLFMLG
jgi:uncharacterized protein (DUF2267 family)